MAPGLGCAQRQVNEPGNSVSITQPMRTSEISGNFIEKEMVIAIREKRDPQAALVPVEKIIEEKWAPTQLKLDAQVWQAALNDWLKEPKRKAVSSQMHLDRAKDLMAQGWRYSSRLSPSQAGLVYYLRAANELQDVTSRGEGSEVYGEALYYSGMNAEVLKEWNLWTHGSDYYEACIRYRPYSLLAQKCFSRLQAMSDKPNAERMRSIRDLVERQQGQFLDWGFID